MPELPDLPAPNDAHAAFAYFKALYDGEGIDEDTAEILIRLQDDPSEYLALVEAFLEEREGPDPELEELQALRKG